MFWLVSILLALAASAFVLAPIVLGRSRTYSDQRTEVNLSLYRERVDELKAAGDWQEDAAFELETKKALLAYIADDQEQSFRLGDRRISMAAALLVPLFALLVYADFGLGRGSLPDVRLASAMVGARRGRDFVACTSRETKDCGAHQAREKPSLRIIHRSVLHV